MESLLYQIEQLKKSLVSVAEAHHMNFQHPDVMEISRKIDHLLLDLMARAHKGINH